MPLIFIFIDKPWLPWRLKKIAERIGTSLDRRLREREILIFNFIQTELVKMKYKIFAALQEDINTGWIWIGKPKIHQRAVVRIVNKKNGKKIYCEALSIDENFRKKYKEDNRIPIGEPDYSIVINEWYRKRLGNIMTQSDYDLGIKETNNIFGRVYATLQHPQVVVRIAMKLGIVSVILGFVGLILGFISIFN